MMAESATHRLFLFEVCLALAHCIRRGHKADQSRQPRCCSSEQPRATESNRRESALHYPIGMLRAAHLLTKIVCHFAGRLTATSPELLHERGSDHDQV